MQLETAIWEYLRNELTWKPSTSAATSYERMPNQGPDDFPGVTRPHDPLLVRDWLFRIDEHRSVLRHLPDNAEVLDIGIGDGWPTLIMFDRCKSVLGIDPAPHRIEVARVNAERRGATNCRFEVADVCALPYPDASFDALTAFSSIEQSPDPPGALAECHRVLRPQGIAIVCVERHEAWISRGDFSESLWVRIREGKAEFQYVLDIAEPVTEEHWFFTLDEPLASELLRALDVQDDLDEIDLREGNRAEAFLSYIRQHSDKLSEREYFSVKHFTQESLGEAFLAAGFAPENTAIEPTRSISSALKPTFERWAETGVLKRIAPFFEDICRGLAESDCPIEPGGHNHWLVVAKK
jgi:SAM-dependent methyltransferase